MKKKTAPKKTSPEKPENADRVREELLGRISGYKAIIDKQGREIAQLKNLKDAVAFLTIENISVRNELRGRSRDMFEKDSHITRLEDEVKFLRKSVESVERLTRENQRLESEIKDLHISRQE